VLTATPSAALNVVVQGKRPGVNRRFHESLVALVTFKFQATIIAPTGDAGPTQRRAPFAPRCTSLYNPNKVD